MTYRIRSLLTRTFDKEQKKFRRDVDWKPLLDGFVRDGTDDSTRARVGLVEMLKAFPVSVSGFRPIDEAIVTAGGVSTREVNPRTMESKRIKGLYFAGEVLDLDAYTGGFNLQIAWSTGRVAGESVLKEEDI